MLAEVILRFLIEFGLASRIAETDFLGLAFVQRRGLLGIDLHFANRVDSLHGFSVGHDLARSDVIHGHSLQVADIDGDRNLDIFSAGMGKWTEAAMKPDNPEAKIWIFFGDGRGNFTMSEIAPGVGNHDSKVANLDGDGRLDILLKPCNWDTPRVDIWLNRGR